jgi:hypothetical protein
VARSVPPRFPGRWLCGVTVDESDRRVPPQTMRGEGQWTMRGGAGVRAARAGAAAHPGLRMSLSARERVFKRVSDE